MESRNKYKQFETSKTMLSDDKVPNQLEIRKTVSKPRKDLHTNLKQVKDNLSHINETLEQYP